MSTFIFGAHLFLSRNYHKTLVVHSEKCGRMYNHLYDELKVKHLFKVDRMLLKQIKEEGK